MFENESRDTGYEYDDNGQITRISQEGYARMKNQRATADRPGNPMFVVLLGCIWIVSPENHSMPFWGKCLAVIVIGIIAGQFLAMWLKGSSGTKLFGFLATVFPLFVMLYDFNGLGFLVVKVYTVLFFAIMALGLVGFWLKAAREALPSILSCVALLAGTVVFSIGYGIWDGVTRPHHPSYAPRMATARMARRVPSKPAHPAAKKKAHSH